jgi:hypothetical protein
MVIPGHNIESQTESGKYHESLVETDVRDTFNNLWYMVQAGEGKETLVPKRWSYTAMSPENYPINRILTKDSGNDEDEYNHKNTFDGSGKWSEIQYPCMVLFPCGQVKISKSGDLRCDSQP